MPPDGGMEALWGRSTAEITPRLTKLVDLDHLDISLGVSLDRIDTGAVAVAAHRRSPRLAEVPNKYLTSYLSAV